MYIPFRPQSVNRFEKASFEVSTVTVPVRFFAVKTAAPFDEHIG